jgi:putative flippase GtrA
MPTARSLTDRLRHLAPEAFAFAVIGAGNTLLYMAIVWVTLSIGVVKANVLATLVTTTLAYLANRYWTYRQHSRSRKRREYTLFFAFNLAGMIIQSGAVAIAKYGFGMQEARDKRELMAVTMAGIAVATVFRFWAYRTFVFRKAAPEAAARAELSTAGDLAEANAAIGGADRSALQPRAATTGRANPETTDGGTDGFDELEVELAAELDAPRPATR